MPVSLSTETLVNIATAGGQHLTDAAALESGVTVLTWLDSSTGTGATANFRLVAPDGTPLGGSEGSVGPASDVAVAGLAGGGFVVVWTATVGPLVSVFSQVHDAAGRPQGEAHVLSQARIEGPILGRTVTDLDVTALSDGGFAATWTSSSHDSQGFSNVQAALVVGGPTGAREGGFGGGVGGDKDTLATPEGAVVQLDDGRLLFTWSNGFEQRAQVLDAAGNAIGPSRVIGEADFNGTTDFLGHNGSDIEVLASGDVAAAWVMGGSLWVSVFPDEALAQGDVSGQTPRQAVATGTFTGSPEITALSDGRFLVTWTSGEDVMARIVGADGAPAGAAFRLESIGLGDQRNGQVVELPGGTILAAWTDASAFTGDPSGAGVAARVIWLGADSIQKGGASGDSMIGGAGADAFAGFEGADTLRGGGGDDTLAGGPGGDVFVLALDGSVDRILDFSGVSGDRLDLRDAGGAPIQEGLLILDEATGLLSWDRDSDAGGATPVAIGRVAADGFDRDDFADGVRVAVRVELESGGRADTVYDWGQAVFDEATAIFDEENQVTTYIVRNDDGTTGQRWWDVDAAQPWSTRAAEYDAAGQVKAYAVTYEDGHTEVFQFDTTNTQTWSRVVDFYDAEGRQSVQAVAWDDGTAFERHHDTYDAHPWAYYIDNYKDGALLNHTFYNADGSVFLA